MYSRADLMYFKDEPVCQAKPEGLDLSGMDLLYRGDHRAPSIGYGDKGGSGGGGGGGYDRKNNYNDDRKRVRLVRVKWVCTYGAIVAERGRGAWPRAKEDYTPTFG